MTLEKLRPKGRALLMPPKAGWAVGESGWVAEIKFVVGAGLALGVTRSSTSILSA